MARMRFCEFRVADCDRRAGILQVCRLQVVIGGGVRVASRVAVEWPRSQHHSRSIIPFPNQRTTIKSVDTQSREAARTNNAPCAQMKNSQILLGPLHSAAPQTAIAIFYPFRLYHPQSLRPPHMLSTLHSLPLLQVPLPP